MIANIELSGGFILVMPRAPELIMQYLLLFLEPGTPGASYFSGADIMNFLLCFLCLGKKHGIVNDELIKMLPEYCE